MANIKLENVTKSYGALEVIPTLNLDIKDNEFVVLVGPSGCGKTTTLRMIAGLETTTNGKLFIGDREVTDIRPGLRNCAMVFQSYALYPHMTVRENIGYGMKVRGIDKETAQSAVANAAKILALEEFLDRKPGSLSGGQRQRVAIGRAIVRDPDVFLFDEPLSNLDAKLRVEMRTEIKQLHRRLKRTIVYVTHDQVEAMTMADRVVVMNKGVVEQAADPITLYEKPDNIFVASFIGAPSMNMLKGRIGKNNDDLVFTSDAGAIIPISAEQQVTLSAYIDQEFVLGIRPEHTGEDAALGAEINIEVIDVEPLGPHTLILGKLGDEKFTAQVSATNSAKPGEMVNVYLNSDKFHFFQASTGKAIR